MTTEKEKLEFVNRFIQTLVLPTLNRALRVDGGHKGGYLTPLRAVDTRVRELLGELDQWNIEGIAPETAERLASLGQRDKARRERQQALEALLHDFYAFTSDPLGLSTGDDCESEDMEDMILDRLHAKYAQLFNE